jgi:hypothetical protein
LFINLVVSDLITAARIYRLGNDKLI